MKAVIIINNKTGIRTIGLYVRLARPKHWLKNIFIFIPVVFAHSLLEPDLFLNTVVAFAAFCFAASSIYALNDIIDADKDKQHPHKQNRPVASGSLTKTKAGFFAVFLLAVCILLIILLIDNVYVLLTIIVYILINVLYSVKLKNYAIIDCFIISAGFLLRIIAGALACDKPISDWLFLTILTMSLALAFGKRRGEMIRTSDTGTGTTRKVLEFYNIEFLSAMMYISAGLAVVFYSMWTVFSVPAMIYTVPLVLFIVCKYLLIIHDAASHGDPTNVLFKDKWLMLSVCLLGIISIILLYI